MGIRPKVLSPQTTLEGFDKHPSDGLQMTWVPVCEITQLLVNILTTSRAISHTNGILWPSRPTHIYTPFFEGDFGICGSLFAVYFKMLVTAKNDGPQHLRP